MKRTYLGLALAMALCGPAGAVRIVDDRGGYAVPAMGEAVLLKQRKEPFVIDGECASACTLTADLARPDTCVERDAVLYFHKARTVDRNGATRFIDISFLYSKDIQAWIAAQGGLPDPGKPLLKMSYRTATRFFRKCAWRERWG